MNFASIAAVIYITAAMLAAAAATVGMVGKRQPSMSVPAAILAVASAVLAHAFIVAATLGDKQ